MFSEDDLVPISALQHYVFCPRRCALIHLERTWDDNVMTAEGKNLHARTHQDGTVASGDVIITHSLRLHSFQLGLWGMSDVVEFHRSLNGVELYRREGRWQPYPVEYKRGILRESAEYKIQLCAQALCLEEMLMVTIPRGALFYGKSKHRRQVEFDDTLRQRTERITQELHNLFKTRVTPLARFEKKCKSCSLLAHCVPKVTGVKKDVARYLASAVLTDEESET